MSASSLNASLTIESYLQNRILLFRPVLSLLVAPEIRSRALSQTPRPASIWLPLAMALPCARECVASALETISIIHERQNWSNEKIIEPLPAWWFEVFFIYTTATALIPARVYSYIRGDVPQSDLLTAWQHSLEVLNHLSPLSPSAVSCIAALQVLDDELVFEQSGVQPQFPSHGPGLPAEPSASNPTSLGNGIRQFGLPVEVPGSAAPAGQHPSFASDLDHMLQMQDFSWLDTLPVDVLASDYADMPDLGQEPW